jgi:hypothetical protein
MLPLGREKRTNRFKRAVLWAALLAIILLVCLLIYGAFLGADRAKTFFNSAPITVYWWTLVALLAVGILLFRQLIRIPSLLLTHLGCILVLVGAMWGSNAGHTLQKQLFGIDKVPTGYMAILENTQENRVMVEDGNDVRELPFFVRLRSFRVEYYPGGTLWIRDKKSGRTWRLAAKPGATLSLGEDLGHITIQRVFENFKIDLEGDQRIVRDEPGGFNPAVEVQIERPDGTTGRRYVFESFEGHASPTDALEMNYVKVIRDYISELEIVRDGVVVAGKNVEVNHPLQYGGYHFYQHSFGHDALGEYTVLMVTSDSGLGTVYAGYVMLIAGVFLHFWRRRARKATGDLPLVGEHTPPAAPSECS